MDGLRLNSIHPYPSLHAAAWAGFFAASVGSAAADAASAAVAAAASTIVDLVIFTICVLCAYFVSSSSSLRTSWSWSSCPLPLLLPPAPCLLLLASLFLAWLGLAWLIPLPVFAVTCSGGSSGCCSFCWSKNKPGTRLRNLIRLLVEILDSCKRTLATRRQTASASWIQCGIPLQRDCSLSYCTLYIHT